MSINIQLALSLIKEAVSNNDYLFVQRKKNMNTLAELGMSIMDVKACILKLKSSNFIKDQKVIWMDQTA